jgi:hypothetical protein
LAGGVSGERRRWSRGDAPAGNWTAVREKPGLNHVLHGELSCDPEKALGRSPGLEKRRRGELDGGGPAAAAGTGFRRRCGSARSINGSGRFCEAQRGA